MLTSVGDAAPVQTGIFCRYTLSIPNICNIASIFQKDSSTPMRLCFPNNQLYMEGIYWYTRLVNTFCHQ